MKTIHSVLKVKIWLPVLLAVLMTSCFNSGRVLPSVTGTQFTLLVVMNNYDWQSPAGRYIDSLFNQNTPELPQAEPMMNLHHCTHVAFDDVLKPVRNILYTIVSDKYKKAKVTYMKDVWAEPQALVKLVAPNDKALHELLVKQGNNILNYFIMMERVRQESFNKQYINYVAQKKVEKMFDIKIDIPQGLSKFTVGKNFFWITNDQARIRKDLVVYSYPYKDKNTFTKAYLIAKRDSVMRVNVPGELKGSYMGTELVYDHPQFRAITVDGKYCAELKGLWKMMNGASMGGPFYSQTRLDEVHHRVVTIEAFVFAPSTNKRNAIRQMEAVVYSAKFPHLNLIKQVNVVAKKPKK